MILIGTGRGAITMKKLILAVALLLATKAGAATVGEATVEVFPAAKDGYMFKFGATDQVDPNIYNAWILSVLVDNVDTGQFWASATSTSDPSMNFPSLYSVQFATPKTSFTVMGVLRLYTNATISTSGTFVNQTALQPPRVDVSNSNPAAEFRRSVVFGAAPQQSLTSETQRAAAVVPIGGTLPLMLTALGLGGWVLRSRTKSATA